MTLRLPRVPDNIDAAFPPIEYALREPNGLLAFGGDLSPQRLLNAYAQGIFPWYGEGQPILWWSPDPRAVFDTESFRLSSRLRRNLRHCDWQITINQAFAKVIDACATVPRRDQDGTWITPQMQDAYLALHQLGHAHSVEIWQQSQLIGGIYGVAIGRMFFGESMFSRQSGASKIALAALAKIAHRCGGPLIDGQVENPHLTRLGAVLMTRQQFLQRIEDLTGQSPMPFSAQSITLADLL